MRERRTYLWNRIAASISSLSGGIVPALILAAFITLFAAISPARAQSGQGGEEIETVSPLVTMQEDAATETSARPVTVKNSGPADPVTAPETASGMGAEGDTALETGDPTPDADQLRKPYAEMTADKLRTEISAEIARMRRDIADVERFKRWQADLMRIARTDREEALRQRLPMSECLASVLAPICDHLTGTFQPTEARDGTLNRGESAGLTGASEPRGETQ